MDSHRRVLVIGGGIFGVTTAFTLGEHGHDVVLIEKTTDLLGGASLVNQNRVHRGYHYPRSPGTGHESLNSLASFNEVYGSAVVDQFEKYYAIAADASLTTAHAFERFCEQMHLPLDEAWPPEDALRRDRIAACWRVPESIFDYSLLRQVAFGRLRRSAGLSLLRNSWPIRARVGPPHRIWLNDGAIVDCDAVVNVSYAGLGAVNDVLGLPTQQFQYELCLLPIVELEKAPRVGVTVMDGPFCSIMPKGREKGRFILYHVALSVLQRAVSHVCPSWEAVDGLSEFDIVDSCAEWFPFVRAMRYSQSWITTRVVDPGHEDDDGRPTTITNHGCDIYSVFSGKLTTCVQAARHVVDALEPGRSHEAQPSRRLMERR